VQAQGNKNKILLHLGRRETPLNREAVPAVFGTGSLKPEAFYHRTVQLSRIDGEHFPGQYFPGNSREKNSLRQNCYE
jgi:hypothetical protein